ncbi:acyl-CoA synthetase [Rhodobacter xanthinilyticus]|uniref:3-methylmercaptopropionyl-CoA ligase n=1 Tax=Rhodobacter xanthinilyticus TaxID=1850250 RepID=A0A1D9MBG7_9RHOB|nr:acyl-CoA synthetase [Rhodobacter xanthinilyticus]AOZ69171.1 acyl-CoA synthetase [Rhodobacter xanthinilyticus]
MEHNIYNIGVEQTPANYLALTPVSFLERSARVFPNRLAVVYNETRRSWGETYARCRQMAGALAARGYGPGDTISIMATNIPEMFEAHFAVPMTGAVLNAINTRLDAEAVAFILSHAETKVIFVDPEFAEIVDRAVHIAGRRNLLVVNITDPSFGPARKIGALDYEALLAEGTPNFAWRRPESEWDAITLNYTSGTTGNPKGVIYHHRGAHLNAMTNIVAWNMGDRPVYLWTLPMFHCNGWCFPWTIAAAAGVAVCLRAVRDEAIFRAMKAEGVTHFCGASVVLAMLVHAPAEMKEGLAPGIKVLTGGAPPPAVIIEKMEALGFDVTHGYGLTETYGPAVTCAWHEEWDALPLPERARLKARQGVRNHAMEDLMVAHPDTMEPVPADGQTMGEIFMRGNNVMKGYLKNPSATDEAFRGGWFASGDLGVMHPDGYIELKDRSKDIIISGGENISSIEVEDVLYKHPEVMEAAVVARPHERWGETPCAFVTLRKGSTIGEAELIAHCRQNMAHFKAPKTVVFGDLPKTSTGKVQKFLLRDRAREMELQG